MTHEEPSRVSEQIGNGWTEIISVEREGNAMSVKTLREKPEIFTSPDEAIRKKVEEIRKENTKNLSLMGLGVVAIVVGSTAILNATSQDNPFNSEIKAYEAFGGAILTNVGVGLTVIGHQAQTRAELARRQLDKIKTTIGNLRSRNNKT